MTVKLKVYELAKELSIDAQSLVDVVQRLGIDIKNTMSVLGTEEVRSIRDHYRKQRVLGKAVEKAQATSAAAKPAMTEKRVGATVIRRRAKPGKAGAVEETPPESETPPQESEALVEQEMQTAPEAEMPSESMEVAAEEQVEEETSASEEVVETQGEEQVESAPPAETTPQAPEKKRRFYPSIIKKTTTEDHLSEKVGPKPLARPPTEKPVAKTTAKPGAPGTAAAGTGDKAGIGIKRVKEVELVPQDVAKDANKRRAADGQTSVFKRADYLKRELVHATKKKKAAMSRPVQKTQITTAAQHKRVVEMPEQITVADFAKQIGVKSSAVIAKLMNLGVSATINQTIDFDTASLVAPEFQHEVKQVMFRENDFIPEMDLAPEKMKSRPPVVTIMGHVDHGKTSLLDSIRKTQVAAGEAGGITQHIGAYTVKHGKGKITFLDTPGHEAFTAMRARGAKVTDLVILVVSATDGVMPQTLESVAHAKAANVPIIVAVNKVDLPDANPDRIKQTLAGHELSPEEWGGETIYVPVSAKTGVGIDKLLESILLQSEMLELKANYDAPARGTVVESKLDKNRGPVATVLIQHGVLNTGDVAVSGTSFGKIRAMTGSNGERMKEAEPGDPVEVLGLPEVPNVGDEMYVVDDEKAAKSITSGRDDLAKLKASGGRAKMSLEDLMAAPVGDELRIILKGDVQGSVEALKEALGKFPQDKVRMKVLHSGTGGISESDVNLAAASNANIVGFNIRPEIKAQKHAEAEGVMIRTYTIIYDLLEDVKKMMEGLLEADVKEKVIGRAEVRSVFHIPKIGAIAGSAVIDGKVQRGCYLRLLRDSKVVYEGKISSLKRFKDDVREVAQGFECGIGLENFNDVKLGDHFEAFIKEEIKQTL